QNRFKTGSFINHHYTAESQPHVSASRVERSVQGTSKPRIERLEPLSAGDIPDINYGITRLCTPGASNGGKPAIVAEFAAAVTRHLLKREQAFLGLQVLQKDSGMCKVRHSQYYPATLSDETPVGTRCGSDGSGHPMVPFIANPGMQGRVLDGTC